MAGIAFTESSFATFLAQVKAGSFSSDKEAFVLAACQSYVFTSKEVAAVLSLVSMSSDKLKMLELFEKRMTDKNESVILASFSFDADKKAATEKLKSFQTVKAGTRAEYKIEDDGHRSESDVQALVASMRKCSMSSDKVAAVKKDLVDKPNPPFDSAQLITILKELSFSNDAIAVLDLFFAPKMLYPMPCTDIIKVLSVFKMSNDQIAILPSLKRFIRDPENKVAVVSHFTFSSDKTKAEEILRDVVVKLEPPTPPPEKIQQVLKTVGRCPAGYDWRQVAGGWRCAAGGHYVSDAAVAAALK